MTKHTLPKKDSEVDKLKEEYDAVFPFAQNLCDEAARQSEKLLKAGSIALGFPIQSRIKTFDSLLNKYQGATANFKKIKDVQDIVGLRIILQFKRDVTKVVNVLRQSFTLVRQYDTQKRLEEDQFGYSATHLIVRIPDEWKNLPTLIGTEGILIEIQVRTIAQHMWAETSQTLQYKQDNSVPTEIKRAINRASALLETIDLEFDRVLDQKASYRQSLENKENVGETLNVDLLEKVLDSLLPPKNKTDDEQYAKLLEELFNFGITTPQNLETLIRSEQTELHERESEQLGSRLKALKARQKIVGTTTERIEKGVFFSHAGLARTALRHAYGSEYISYEKQQDAKQQEDAPSD